MEAIIKSIRPFLGAKNFELSRKFYVNLGFVETVLNSKLSVFKMGDFAFYLQDAYVKDWVDNSMVFLEVSNVNEFWNSILQLNLTEKYRDVRLIPIQEYDWGREFFIHDTSGVLWHIGEFVK
ncbi:glyoxalase [Flavobacterium adhaerens]|uniref:glyoxalase n=1 Tax=Flavobacterium adhaerens TaxID=3149043 RepID=UPI0032B4EA41